MQGPGYPKIDAPRPISAARASAPVSRVTTMRAAARTLFPNSPKDVRFMHAQDMDEDDEDGEERVHAGVSFARSPSGDPLTRAQTERQVRAQFLAHALNVNTAASATGMPRFNTSVRTLSRPHTMRRSNSRGSDKSLYSRSPQPRKQNGTSRSSVRNLSRPHTMRRSDSRKSDGSSRARGRHSRLPSRAYTMAHLPPSRAHSRTPSRALTPFDMVSPTGLAGKRFLEVAQAGGRASAELPNSPCTFRCIVMYLKWRFKNLCRA